ncbi:hypothetical protein V6N13_026226 [Hibiscus sabdariffa]|uniref:O-methyltransferase C-terminal domain-containing protein n=1 Tax=Hibiscus sabdariffa TaxID=183260 RepID=A0ABR2P5Q7_9ROSI
MFRLLASYSVLTCSSRTLPDDNVERLYGLDPICEFFTKNKDVLEGGDPFHKAYGKDLYEYNGMDPRFSKAFDKGMSDHSTITMKKILETYDIFEGIKTLVDVGGSIGALLHVIVSKYPTIKGNNFDLPYVIKNAPSYPGVEYVGGDMFETVPKGDVIFMKILKKCYEALPENGKVIVTDSNHSDYPDASTATKFAALFDCFMMRGDGYLGRERTAKEFEALAKGAGFQGFQVKCCAYDTYIMEFYKTA